MKRHSKTSGTPRRGMAMLLVTVALALAAVMATALLAGTSLRTKTCSSAQNGVAATYLAESAMNIAMFYVQHPDSYSGSKPNGYYPGEMSINLGAGAPGTVSTNVTYNAASKRFTITANAAVVRGDQKMSRRTTAVIEGQTSPAAKIGRAASGVVTMGNLLIRSGTTYSGLPDAIKSLGTITVESGGVIEGAVDAQSVTIKPGGSVVGTISSATTSALDDLSRVVSQSAEPTFNNGTAAPVSAPPPLNDLSRPIPDMQYYPDLRTYQWTDAVTGVTKTYSAVKLTAGAYSNTTLGPTTDNPAGIFWADRDTELRADTSIYGTLIMTSGKELRFGDGAVKIQAGPGLPAIVSDGNLKEAKSSFDISGLVIAKNLTGHGDVLSNSVLRGALLLTDSATSIDLDTGQFRFYYDPAKADAPGFGTVSQNWEHQALRIVSWTEK